MSRKSKIIISTALVALCVLCATICIWSVFQRNAIHVQVTGTDLLSHEVPIRYVNNQPLVDCLVNGNAAVMEIDTGATSILLDEASLVRLHIAKGSRSHEAGVLGGVSIEVSSLSAFTIAFPKAGISAEIRGASSAVFADASYDGLLGSDFLQASGARIDYQRGVLEFQYKADADRK